MLDSRCFKTFTKKMTWRNLLKAQTGGGNQFSKSSGYTSSLFHCPLLCSDSSKTSTQCLNLLSIFFDFYPWNLLKQKNTSASKCLCVTSLKVTKSEKAWVNEANPCCEALDFQTATGARNGWRKAAVKESLRRKLRGWEACPRSAGRQRTSLSLHASIQLLSSNHK